MARMFDPATFTRSNIPAFAPHTGAIARLLDPATVTRSNIPAFTPHAGAIARLFDRATLHAGLPSQRSVVVHAPIVATATSASTVWALRRPRCRRPPRLRASTRSTAARRIIDPPTG
jgi:hypothetical protein